MYLAWRELRAASGRFALVGVVIALIALLSVLLTGLAVGLVDDGISGLRSQSLTHLVVQDGSDGVFSKSTLNDSSAAAIDSVPAEVSALGVSFFNSRSSSGRSVDLAVFGVSDDSFLLPHVDGSDALVEPDTIVISHEVAADGIDVGDTLTILGSELELTVTGVADTGSYGHVPIAYTSLVTWQEALYGKDAKGRFSALAVRTDHGQQLESLDLASEGLEVFTKREAYAGSPGYTAETSTMTLIRSFLVAISALIVGAFATVWTVQRTREIGLMKALGASDGYVVRDAIGQLGVVIIAATFVGGMVGWMVGLLVPDEVPFRLSMGSTLSSLGLLAAIGFLGAAITVRRISRVDPLISLGADR